MSVCTILIDGVKYNRNQTLIIFFVYCPLGFFHLSIDSSNLVKSVTNFHCFDKIDGISYLVVSLFPFIILIESESFSIIPCWHHSFFRALSVFPDGFLFLLVLDAVFCLFHNFPSIVIIVNWCKCLGLFENPFEKWIQDVVVLMFGVEGIFVILKTFFY